MAQILLVDDEEDLVEMLALRLEAEGYSVMTACDGPQALKLAGEHSFDAIILDLIMPGMNGWEVTEMLRKSPKTDKTPIIIATAAASKDLKQKGQSVGVTEVITKPFDDNQLLGLLSQLLLSSNK